MSMDVPRFFLLDYFELRHFIRIADHGDVCFCFILRYYEAVREPLEFRGQYTYFQKKEGNNMYGVLRFPIFKGAGSHDPAHVLYFDKKSRFYNNKGGETLFSALKVGDRVKVKLFPRSYGGIIHVRKYKTVRWIKVLPNR